MARKQIKKELPKLPYGEGSLAYRGDKIQYRKSITLPDRSKTTGCVTCDTIKECFAEMAKVEERLKRNISLAKNNTLAEEMYDWLETRKKVELRKQSFDRLKKTVKNQIETSDIGHVRYRAVTADEVQRLIKNLNEKELSYSVIKKTYDALNAFYRYVSARDKFDNPMLLVTMPTQKNISAVTKNIEFFNAHDIEKFENESRALYNTGNPKYRYGRLLAANMYLGLRIGELRSVTWGDVDFTNNTMLIHTTAVDIVNEEYNPDNTALMNELGIRKTKSVVQDYTKTATKRYVPINSKAKALLQEHFRYTEYKDKSDFLMATINGKMLTTKNATDCLQAIQKQAETVVQKSGTHVLRHTCASLYFRAGVDPLTISKILGNTVEVLEKTYVHFIEEQLKDAASKIEVVEI